MSSDAAPTPGQLRDVQIWLNHLDKISESRPRTVIEETDRAMAVLATWRTCDAYGWALAVRTKAFRLLDDLPAVLETTESGVAALGEHGGIIAAHLHLEAGMALNQFDRQPEAAVHLEKADKGFEAAGDAGGRAWALVSLAEAYSGSGYPKDPEPVLASALRLADQAGDIRASRRAWKQMAVVYRHRGQIVDALEAIQHALEGAPATHPRANYLLELGHLLAWSGDYAGSDEAFEEAAALYTEYTDSLGSANTERALANNALILGRVAEGLRRLDRAVEKYREINSTNGLGYVLRERAVVRLNEGDASGAIRDIDEGLDCFRASPDSLGLAGMLRAAARVRHETGDAAGALDALTEARELTAAGTNPLAEAGVLSMEAEIGAGAAQRHAAATAAADLYGRMGLRAGEALALSFASCASAELGDPAAAVATMRHTASALRAARIQVSDPGRRADHDFSLRDVITNLLNVAKDIDTADATRIVADLLLDAAPLGLRNHLCAGDPGERVTGFLARVKGLSLRADSDPRAQRHLLQQLSALLATLAPGEQPPWIGFEQLVAAHPDQAIVVAGAPTRDSTLPIVWQVPGGEPRFALVPLSTSHIDQIDSLGYATTAERADVLWRPEVSAWQADLAHILLPNALQDWLVAHPAAAMAVVLPPILSHVPIEALLIGDTPLGIRAAVTRLPVPTTATMAAAPRDVIAYLDPDLPWTPERAALPNWTDNPAELREALGPAALLMVGCHGESALRAEGCLVASDGTRVIDAIDMLSQPLTGSVAVLEACFSGRYMGTRAGEQLNLATVCLLAGASAVVAGLFALPADDECTGVITATLLRELQAGTAPAEALRRARETYYNARPQRVRLPGAPGSWMPGDAVWAWAGLCLYGR
ncbi:CHAT domain-containing protein [Nocardia sp. NPDC005366]|uniref:CHAT domain-containing protein n=1 Tax=Nocardia sp. NPDC005366 TaxID=3156878 RepID=UPI0033A873BF